MCFICMNLSIVFFFFSSFAPPYKFKLFFWCAAAAASYCCLLLACLLPIKSDMWYHSDIVCKITAIFNFDRMLWNEMCVFFFTTISMILFCPNLKIERKTLTENSRHDLKYPAFQHLEWLGRKIAKIPNINKIHSNWKKFSSNLHLFVVLFPPLRSLAGILYQIFSDYTFSI